MVMVTCSIDVIEIRVIKFLQRFAYIVKSSVKWAKGELQCTSGFIILLYCVIKACPKATDIDTFLQIDMNPF